MREYYIFYIVDGFLSIYKNNSYYLYENLKTIYELPKNSVINGYYLLSNLVNQVNLDDINNALKYQLKENEFYSKYLNHHFYNNYYTKESSELIIKNIFMKIKTTKNKPIFFSYLYNKNNVFICDFHNKDYFWLQEIRV